MKKQTQLIHHDYQPPQGFESMSVPVCQASTILFPCVDAIKKSQWQDRSAYTYGTHGTPTTFTLEQRIATLEGAQHALLMPSGLAAITLVDMAFLQSGDEVLIPDNAYEPNASFALHELARWGIQARFYDPMDPEDLRQCLSAATRLVWMEAAGSITLEFPDVPALCEVIHSSSFSKQRRILTAVDHTWGGGIAYCPFDWGVDIAVHALTKYPSGAADVLMGSVSTSDQALFEALQMTQCRLGACIQAQEAQLILRGLSTIEMRYHAVDSTTQTLAKWIQSQPCVQKVFHPCLEDSPGHENWKRLTQQKAACLIGVLFQPDISEQVIVDFCNQRSLFSLGYSWAGPMSLILPYQVAALRRRGWAYQGQYIRLAIGYEDEQALQADLQKGFDSLLK